MNTSRVRVYPQNGGQNLNHCWKVNICYLCLLITDTAWNVSKYQLEKTPYLDTFHAVRRLKWMAVEGSVNEWLLKQWVQYQSVLFKIVPEL